MLILKRRTAMNKEIMSVIVVTLVAVGLNAMSWAAQGGEEFVLMSTKEHPGATGTAIISAQNISIEANGLKPNSVYTAWFVNMKPKKNEAGAGHAPYMFKTDSSGKGTYSSKLDKSPFGKWEMLMIVLHPTGDPADMKNMVGALSANLKAK
jgi:hypothetical protein